MEQGRGARPGDADAALEVLERRPTFSSLSSGSTTPPLLCLTCGAAVHLVTGEEPDRHRRWHESIAVLAVAALNGGPSS